MATLCNGIRVSDRRDVVLAADIAITLLFHHASVTIRP